MTWGGGLDQYPEFRTDPNSQHGLHHGNMDLHHDFTRANLSIHIGLTGVILRDVSRVHLIYAENSTV